MRRMLPDGRRLGAHLPLADGMVKAADRAHEIGATALQIFTDNPTAWQRRAAAPLELAAFRARLIEHDIAPVAAHASYLVNLAGPEMVSFDRSIELLARELHAAPAYGVRLVNVHIGSHRDSGLEVGTRRIAEAIDRTFRRLTELDVEGTTELVGPTEAATETDHGTPELEGTTEAATDDGMPDPAGPARATDDDASGVDAPDPTGPPAMLVLENSAGSGWGLGTNVTELAAIADAIAKIGVPAGRVGFCLDTAHAWGAGVDLADPEATDAFLADFDARIGIDRLVMVHLNDSRAERGSRTDRHEHVGAGRIGEAGMAHVLRHPLLARAAYILETPGMDEGYDAVNLGRARAIAVGEPLATLPPAAFHLRSARGRSAPPDPDATRR
jgi:deoxyribonuclease-4